MDCIAGSGRDQIADGGKNDMSNEARIYCRNRENTTLQMVGKNYIKEDRKKTAL